MTRPAVPMYAYDVETTILVPYEGAEPSAAPHWPGNRVVWSGIASETRQHIDETGAGAWDKIANRGGPVLVAGHALGFDMLQLLWAKGEPALRWLLNPQTHLFDTQTVDYLIQGCSTPMPSLETTGARYGVAIHKDEEIAAYFESGKGFDVVVRELGHARAHAYLSSDLRGTWKTAKAQQDYINTHLPDLKPVIAVQMLALKLVILCHYFGMPIDLLKLHEMGKKNAAELAASETELQRALSELMPDDTARLPFNRETKKGGFNITSPAQLGALLFGGTAVYTTKVERGTYKTGPRRGQIKLGNHEHTSVFPGLFPGFESHSTKEDVLERIIGGKDTPETARQFLRKLLKVRELGKLDGTYFKPMEAQTRASRDGRLHGEIHMSVTNTGRKSSSKPNLQNIPNSVRAAIALLIGNKRRILTADFKQLEVVALAYLSRDPALRKALLEGKDIHGIIRKRVEKMTGSPVKRTDVKRVVFGRFYGGGAATLSAQSGIPVQVVEAIIDTLDTLFPVAAKVFRQVQAALNRDRVAIPGGGGLQQYQALYRLPSGRRLMFRTDPETGAFGFTEMKNRPIQSLATADFVPFAESELVRWLWTNIELLISGDLRIVCVVHDEIVFEVNDISLPRVADFLRGLSRDMVSRMNDTYRLSPVFDLPLAIEAGLGYSWEEAKKDESVYHYAEAA